MNSFGRSFRVSVLGESHGECVGVLIDGCPAGLELNVEDFRADLERRMGGTRQGSTTRKEADIPLIKSGYFNGSTTGAPLLILFENLDVKSSDYDKIRTTPRPGHADLVAKQKFGGFNDYRGGGHFSGRLTAPLVAAGVIAKKLIHPIIIEATITEVGGSSDIDLMVEQALAEGDSVGGVIECRAKSLPVGLGEPFFDSIESLLSHAAFSIPAVKGIEFGSGFGVGRGRGSEFSDDIIDVDGHTASNHSGGVNGGISNGNEVVFRIAVKPTSSTPISKKTVDLESGSPTELSVNGRHDVCIALRVPPVLEAVTAIVLTDLMIQAQKIPRVIELKEPFSRLKG